MKAKVKTNVDRWNDMVYPELEIGKEYEVVDVVIHSWSTDVYLENGKHYNSSMFDNKFQKKLDKMIDTFNSDEDSQVGDRIGVFTRDWC